MKLKGKLFIRWSKSRTAALAFGIFIGTGSFSAALAFGLDSDGDGIPNQWEILNGLDPDINDAGLDPDNDGVINSDEYTADTDPWNNESMPQITLGFWEDGQTRQLSAITSSNRVYAVEYCDDLTNGSWTALAENIPGDGSIGLSADEEPAVSNRFYRMTVGFSSLHVTPDPLGFGPVTIGETSSVQTVYVSNSSSTNQILADVVKTGANAGDFILSSLPATNYVLAPNSSVLFDVAFAPSTNGSRNAQLELQFSGNITTNLYVDLSGAATYDYYINAGELEYTGPTNFWESDAGYFNVGGPYADTNTAISATDRDLLYQTERFGNLTEFGQELTYHIPVVPGTYEVVLHFAEIFVTGAGQRVFDVEVEGAPFLTDFDLYAEAGFAAALATNTVIEVSDYSIDIEFISQTDNPKVSAIEVHSLTQ